MAGIAFRTCKENALRFIRGHDQTGCPSARHRARSELLFLDEPTAGLDPDSSEGFVDLIRSYIQSCIDRGHGRP